MNVCDSYNMTLRMKKIQDFDNKRKEDETHHWGIIRAMHCGQGEEVDGSGLAQSSLSRYLFLEFTHPDQTLTNQS